MPANTIQYAHAEFKILIIQPPDWNQPKGYSAEIRIFLGPGTDSLPATAETIPGGRAFIRCESLFSGGPKGGIPLPLEIGDIVEFALEGADVRVLAVKKGQRIVEPTASFTDMPINVLFAAHPTPPDQPAVGNAPIGFLTTLNTVIPGSYDPMQFAATFVPSAKLTRAEVRAICRNRAINPLAAYAVAMAWGLQDPIDFTDSVKHGGLLHLLNALRISPNDRRSDFDVATKAKVRGLGIAFFTKVLYFFRPNPDAYILDQWTAKSACILFSPSPVRIGSRGLVTGSNAYYGPHSKTTADEYEAFCSAVDGLLPVLWPGHRALGDRAEAAMFDKGGSWRQFVRDHYFHKEVGNSLRRKAICLTTAQDFDDGWLVLKIDKKVVVFVTATKGGESGLRVLLARLRELGATEVVFPTGNGGIPLPDWFIQGCNALRVKISGGGNAKGGLGGGGPAVPNSNLSHGLDAVRSNREGTEDPSRVQNVESVTAGEAGIEPLPQDTDNENGQHTAVHNRKKITVEKENGSYLPINSGGNNIGYICYKSPSGGHYGKIAIYTQLWDLLVAAGCRLNLPLERKAPFWNPPSQIGKIRIHRPAGNSPRLAIEWLEQFFHVKNNSTY